MQKLPGMARAISARGLASKTGESSESWIKSVQYPLSAITDQRGKLTPKKSDFLPNNPENLMPCHRHALVPIYYQQIAQLAQK